MFTTSTRRATRIVATTFLGIAIGLGTSGVAFAEHSDHHHHWFHRTHAEGTITALGTNSVTVHRDNGATVTWDTTSATVVAFEGHGPTPLTSLAVGEKVDVTLTSTAPQSLVRIVIDVVHFDGTVSAVSGNTITLANGRSVDVTSSTTFILASGASATLASVLVGDQISAWGPSGSPALTLNAVNVRIGSFL
jgi:hypothetical protein